MSFGKRERQTGEWAGELCGQPSEKGWSCSFTGEVGTSMCGAVMYSQSFMMFLRFCVGGGAQTREQPEHILGKEF